MRNNGLKKPNPIRHRIRLSSICFSEGLRIFRPAPAACNQSAFPFPDQHPVKEIQHPRKDKEHDQQRKQAAAPEHDPEL